MTWHPRAHCLTRLSVPNALERYQCTPKYIRELVAAEDLIQWGRGEIGARPVPLPAPLPRLKLTPTAAFILGRQMIKRVPSLVLP